MPLLAGALRRAAAALAALERTTRPMDPERAAALSKRWDELPAAVRTPSQMLGRRIAGCEATHGVFPRCNLACTPCYHSREANRVPVDGAHTLRAVDAQMRLLRRERGPGQHAQLIGGEVTLLAPDDHAAALAAMIRHDRKPMSMTHGDFDYAHLRAIALDPRTGRPRFRHLAFAAHVDTTMRGRRGIARPRREADLNPHRHRFCAMFARLRREHGVTSYLAHNMTVTEENVDQIPDVLRACRTAGFSMFSFQPAAHLGNPARWRGDFRAIGPDDVWARIEEGAGGRLHHRAIQYGDPRCNRTSYGGYASAGHWTLFDDDDPRDARAWQHFLTAYGGMDFGAPRPLLAARLARGMLAHPPVAAAGIGLAARLVRRMGGARRLIGDRPRAVTYVMHNFMDARVVQPAWEALERGEISPDPEIGAAQERLRACSYTMAHADTGRLVPACAQHAVFDEAANRRLIALLGQAAEGPAAPAGR